MAKKKTDPEIHLTTPTQQFWCEHCKRAAATDKHHLQCDTCGDPMIPMEKVRRQSKGKP